MQKENKVFSKVLYWKSEGTTQGVAGKPGLTGHWSLKYCGHGR